MRWRRSIRASWVCGRSSRCSTLTTSTTPTTAAGFGWAGTRADGNSLALEHTLIQPFVGEKFDSEVFMKAFGRIEKNPALVLPERKLDVIIPVHAKIGRASCR